MRRQLPAALALAAALLPASAPASADYESVNAIAGAPEPTAHKDNPTQVPVSVNAALNDDPLGNCFYSGGGNGQQVLEPTVKTKAQCPVPPNDRWERLPGAAYGAQDVYLTGD